MRCFTYSFFLFLDDGKDVEKWKMNRMERNHCCVSVCVPKRVSSERWPVRSWLRDQWWFQTVSWQAGYFIWEFRGFQCLWNELLELRTCASIVHSTQSQTSSCLCVGDSISKPLFFSFEHDVVLKSGWEVSDEWIYTNVYSYLYFTLPHCSYEARFLSALKMKKKKWLMENACSHIMNVQAARMRRDHFAPMKY